MASNPWPAVALSEVVELPSGKNRVPTVAESGPVLTFKGLRPSGEKDFGELVSVADATEGGMTFLQPGDVVGTNQGHASGWILKKVGFINAQESPAYAASTLQVFRPIQNLINPRFLYQYLVWPATYQKVAEMAGPRNSFTAKMFKDVPVPLPPIEEQRRIASILDAADALRAKRRQALEKLDSLTQSIFIDMFGDPVINSRDWPLADLQDLGTLDRGVSKHRPRNDPALLGGAWPLIQTGEVAASGGYIDRFESTYSDLGLAQSRLWPAGTLCITIAANIAKTGILQFEACFPDSVVGFTAIDRGTVEYVRSVLNFLQPALEKQAPESAQKNINLKVLRELKVPVPPNDLRAKFAEWVEAVNGGTKAMSSQIRLNDSLFASLQHRAFRGEL